MKLQDVILKAMAQQLTWIQAAEIAGMSVRNLQRKRQAYQEFGYTGLFDQRRGKRSIHRVPMDLAERVLALYQATYFDLSVRHFHEKLRDEHSIRLSYSWVKQALQGAGLVVKRKKRGPHRRRRPRRPLPGMLLHIDASTHRWFQDDRYYDLIVILDDATSEIYHAQLVEEESTRTVMAAVWDVVARKGAFCALYSDRASHFFHTPKAGQGVDRTRLTQFGRALRDLSIQLIPAYSPQARGRSERSFSTWQGRLPQELRLAGITTLAAANAFLRERYIAAFNAQFSVPAEARGTAFRPCSRKDLDAVFSIPDRARGGPGQHRRHRRAVVAARQARLGPRARRSDRHHPSTPRRHGLDPLRPPRGRPWKRRRRGKPPRGFPPPLGNRRRRFPLSHRPEFDALTFRTQIQKGKEGSMKPNRTTHVSTKPDNFKS